MLINRWIFYLIGMADGLIVFFMVIGIFAIISGCVTTIVISIDDGFTKYSKASLKVAIFGIIFTFIGLLIPTKEVSYQMLAASLVTKDNIEYVTEAGKDLVDYIIETAERMSEAIEGEENNDN